MSLRVLYVDDEPDIREIVALSLGLDPALKVETVGSGAEALARARKGDLDLVLLDVMMPAMDGPTTFARMREDPVARTVPVAFVTARTQAHEVAHFLKLGAVGVIAKPFDPMSLAADVRRLGATAEA